MPEPFRSLYPERELYDCPRCGCEHYRPGRCFRDDEAGWPIMAKAMGPREDRIRRGWTPAVKPNPSPEGRKPEGQGTPWWT